MRARVIKIGNSQGLRIPKPILEQTGILDDVEIEVEKDKIMNPIELLKSKTLNKNNSFSKALIEFKKKNSTAIIAEIKKASPSKGILKNDFNHIDIAEEFYNNNAACLSVLTEKKYFHGDKSFVNDIKKKFDIPILNKLSQLIENSRYFLAA